MNSRFRSGIRSIAPLLTVMALGLVLPAPVARAGIPDPERAAVFLSRDEVVEFILGGIAAVPRAEAKDLADGLWALTRGEKTIQVRDPQGTTCVLVYRARGEDKALGMVLTLEPAGWAWLPRSAFRGLLGLRTLPAEADAAAFQAFEDGLAAALARAGHAAGLARFSNGNGMEIQFSTTAGNYHQLLFTTQFHRAGTYDPGAFPIQVEYPPGLNFTTVAHGSLGSNQAFELLKGVDRGTRAGAGNPNPLPSAARPSEGAVTAPVGAPSARDGGREALPATLVTEFQSQAKGPRRLVQVKAIDGVPVVAQTTGGVKQTTVPAGVHRVTLHFAHGVPFDFLHPNQWWSLDSTFELPFDGGGSYSLRIDPEDWPNPSNTVQLVEHTPAGATPIFQADFVISVHTTTTSVPTTQPVFIRTRR